MKKLTSMIDQFSDRGFPAGTVEEVRRQIQKDLEKSGLASVAKNYLRYRYSAITLLIVTIVFVALLASPLSDSSQVAFIALLAIFGISTILAFIGFSRYRNMWKRGLSTAVDDLAITRILIESKYENVKVISLVGPNKMSQITRLYRSVDIPADATYWRDGGGIAMKLNGHNVFATRATWRWVRQFDRNTQVYYKDNFYMFSDEYSDKFKNFSLQLGESSWLSNRGHELENDHFNKMFSYSHNDPIRLRMLFTPLTQEIMSENFQNLAGARSTRFIKDPYKYIMFKTLTGTPFTVDSKVTTNMDNIINSAAADLMNDTAYILDNLSFIATMRELVNY